MMKLYGIAERSKSYHKMKEAKWKEVANKDEKQRDFFMLFQKNIVTDPMPEIVGEDEVASERVGECVVEIQDLDELVPFDGV